MSDSCDASLKTVFLTVRPATEARLDGDPCESPGGQSLDVTLRAWGPAGVARGREWRSILTTDDCRQLRKVARGESEEHLNRHVGEIVGDLMLPQDNAERDEWNRILSTDSDGVGEVRLFIDVSEELAWIPFEFAFLRSEDMTPLVKRDGVSVARWAEGDATGESSGEPGIKALIVAGAPSDMPVFDGIDLWSVGLAKRIRAADPQAKVDVERSGIDGRAVAAVAATGPFDVLVLAVHGGVENGDPRIFLEDRNGRLPVTVEEFVDLFGVARCVILLACDGASTPHPGSAGSEADSLSSYSFARALAVAGVEATVGFVGEETWEQARTIGASIVGAIAGGEDIYAAVREARQAVGLGYSWGRLRLFARGEGRFGGIEARKAAPPVADNRSRVAPGSPLERSATGDVTADEVSQTTVGATFVPFGIRQSGLQLHLYSVSAGRVSTRLCDRASDLPLLNTDRAEDSRIDSLVLSPAGKVLALLSGKRLQLLRIDQRTGQPSLVHEQPIELSGERLRVLAVSDPQRLTSSSTTCLIACESETLLVRINVEDGSADVIRRLDGRAIDGVVSAGGVVLLHSDKVTVEGGTFGFCRAELQTVGGRLHSVDCVRSGGDLFVLGAFDEGFVVYRSTGPKRTQSETLPNLAAACLVRPSRSDSPISAIAVFQAETRLVPVRN